jgi:uncharacterized protein YkwD
MKHYLSSIIGVLTTVLGIATTAQANPILYRPARPSISTPAAKLIWQNGRTRVIGSFKSSPAPSSTYLTMNSLELGVYQKVNQYRQSRHLPPLIVDPSISAQAKAHSQEMARTGTLSHRIESSAQKIAYPTAAENISTSRGYRYPEIVAVQGWISSPLHHQNLIGRYNLTGVGVAQNAKGEYYFTQIFIYKH